MWNVKTHGKPTVNDKNVKRLPNLHKYTLSFKNIFKTILTTLVMNQLKVRHIFSEKNNRQRSKK